MALVPVAELQDYIGKELGHSEWLNIDQERINQFAECTGDHRDLHSFPTRRSSDLRLWLDQIRARC